MNEISGVNEASQGQRAASGTPSSLYAQEAINSSLNTKDYFDTFNELLRDRNMKALQTIVQFYPDRRKIALAGSNYAEEAMTYDPERAQQAEVDVVMSQTADSPAYRSIIEGSLQELRKERLIDLEMYLKNSPLPFSDKLLEDVRAKQEQMIQSGQIDPTLLGAVGGDLQNQGANAAQADPNTMAMLQKYIG